MYGQTKINHSKEIEREHFEEQKGRQNWTIKHLSSLLGHYFLLVQISITLFS